MLQHYSPDELHDLVEITNRELLMKFGHTGVCVLATATLIDVLGQLGVPARPLRVEAFVPSLPNGQPDQHGCILGGDGDGTRLPAAKRGHWRGHLVAITEEKFLLDATLDQVNISNPWLGARPVVAEISSAFLQGEASLWLGLEQVRWEPLATFQTPWPGTRVRYHAFPNRGGFKSAPDWRPSHRRQLVGQVLKMYSPTTH